MIYEQKNILLIGLNDKFDKKITKTLSDRLDMFYVDVLDFIEYELIDSGKVTEVCGVDYLKEQEKKIIKRLSTYENSVIHINYDLFVNNLGILEKTSFVIYLKTDRALLSFDDLISKIAYEDRDKILSNRANLIIDIKYSNQDVISDILEKLGGVK